MRHVSYFLLIVAGVCLSACGTSTQVDDPAKARASTEVFREKDGSLRVVGDWDYIEVARAAIPQRVVAGGLEAHIVRGSATYAHACVKGVWNIQASDMQLTPEDIEYTVKEHQYDRATLERAAAGAGLVVPLPHLRQTQSQSFSPAYVRGFLQKVDEVLANPAGSGAKPLMEEWYQTKS